MSTPSALPSTATTPGVTLVGAGPGDPDLLTLKAIKALRQATVVLVDDLVHLGVLRYVRKSARVVPVGKRGGCASTPQAFIQRLMVHEALRGERVVRLKGGDPFVFGRGAEECEALRAAGVPVQVVSGLTAGIAGPAAAGISVTDRRLSSGVVLVTGHTQEEATTASAREGLDDKTAAAPNWAALAQSGLTLVIYMAISRASQVAQELLQAGLCGSTSAAVVSAAHTPQQRSAHCTLASLGETVRREQLASPAVLVIGDVARAKLVQTGDQTKGSACAETLVYDGCNSVTCAQPRALAHGAMPATARASAPSWPLTSSSLAVPAI